jgi:uncharacterized membrane protein
MSEAISRVESRLQPPAAPFAPGRCIFSAAVIAFGVETIVVARNVAHPLDPHYDGIPVIPWLPAIVWVAYLFGAIWVACGVGMLIKTTRRMAAIALGVLLFACTLILIVPKYAVALGNMGLRTVVLEPISIACLAWLLAGPNAVPLWLARVSRYLIGISLIVFGVDHFLALIFIASLIPAWIPLHVFWVAFFGAAMIVAGISIGLNILPRWGAAGIGTMFGIYVITLHIPRVLGLYGIPGAPHNPNEWSSLFIAAALWGGFWALAGPPER